MRGRELVLTMIVLVSISSAFALTAEGSNVTDAKIVVDLGVSANVWQGYYGNYTPQTNSKNTSFSGSITTVDQLNLKIGYCFESNLYATTLQAINWSLVKEGNQTNVDNFSQISSLSTFSATKIFTNTRNFTVNGNILELPSAKTGGTGDFYMGLLRQGSNPIFVVNANDSGIAFNGNNADYQLMLPAPRTETKEYFFHTDGAIDCESPRIELPNNITVAEGSLVNITYNVTDPNLDLITINFSSPFDENGTWQTGYFDSGTYEITVAACDNESNCVSENLNITILNVEICGDFYCDINETCSSCSSDCGTCGGGGGGSGRDEETVTSDLEERISKILLHLEKKEFDENVLSTDDKIEERRQLIELIHDVRTVLLSGDSVKEKEEKIAGLEKRFKGSIEDIPKTFELKHKETIFTENVAIIERNNNNTEIEKKIVSEKTFEIGDLSKLDNRKNIYFELLTAIYDITYFNNDTTEISTTLIKFFPEIEIKNLNISITLPPNIILDELPHIEDVFAEIEKTNSGTIVHFANLNVEKGKLYEIGIKSKGSMVASDLKATKIVASYNQEIKKKESKVEICEYNQPNFWPLLLALLLLLLALLFIGKSPEAPLNYNFAIKIKNKGK